MSRTRRTLATVVVALSSWSCGSTAPDATPEVAAIVVSPASSTLTLNAQLPLQAQVQDGSGAVIPDATVTWTVQDPKILRISAAGVVTALALGTSQVAANALGKSGTATITVSPPPVQSVTVSPQTLSLIVGRTGTLSATVLDVTGAAVSNPSVSWSSSNPAVASVIPSSGVVTAEGVGSATIEATSGGKKGTATVTVDPGAVATVAVTGPSQSLKPGSTMQLTAAALDSGGNVVPNQSFFWSSSNPNVASVSSSGLVTGLRNGNVTITAYTTLIAGKSGSFSINVK
jgi:uncharacterized protein YjdB